MITEEINFTLKDGRRAVLRNPKEEEAEELLNYFRTAVGETDFLLMSPQDCENYTAESERAFIRGMNGSDSVIMLTCFVGKEVAGNCQLTFKTNLKERHRATIDLAILRKFWNLGIGSAIFENLIALALRNEDILQLELDFLEGHVRARAHSEKFGFRIVGVRPKAYRLKEGTYLNEYIMIKELQRENR